MKKTVLLFACLFILQITTMRADNDRPIAVTQLPIAAQQFIKRHFPESRIALVKKEVDFLYKSYEVIFTDGKKVEFDKKGQWKDVDCKFSAVPMDIVPAPILNHIQSVYPGTKVVHIDRDKDEYDLQLSNRVELVFDSRFNLIDIDD